MSREKARSSIVFVTGPSGAGRSTAINAFEDLGYETIESLPLDMLPRLLSGPVYKKPLALGIDVRTRDFSVGGVLDAMAQVARHGGYDGTLLFVDCDINVLLRRYSETRRRHPLAPAGSPRDGIEAELRLLAGLRNRADVFIDTSEMSPHELRAEIDGMFGGKDGAFLAVSLQSFSYKRGLPRDIDMVLDCRFLRNPYWEESLRSQTGLDRDVQAYVRGDPRFRQFFDQLTEMVDFLLPAYRDEGKSHFCIGLGCTGGCHRSVSVAEDLAKALAPKGWQVSIRHRELERRAEARSEQERSLG
jgi:UPF0042 nucleotide-binding protein